MQEDPTGNFLRSAAGAELHHNTASLAAAAMNAAKPAAESKPTGINIYDGGESGGYNNYASSSNNDPGDPVKIALPAEAAGDYYRDSAEENTRSMAPGSAPSAPKQASKPAPQMQENHQSAGVDSSGAPPPPADLSPAEWDSSGMMNSMQIQALQAQMFAHQSYMAQMMGQPMFPPWMNPMFPPMDASSMGKGAMPPFMQMYPGMSPMPGAPGMPQTAATPKSKSGGKGEKNREKKPRRGKAKGNPAAAPDPADDENKMRSEALMEVRKTNGKGCKLTLGEVLPHIIEFSKDQHGSRYLQNLLEPSQDSSEIEKQQAFEAILPETKQLANDVFGNFVIQKFFDIGSPEMRKQLAEQMRGDVLKLTQEMYGCRVIQKALVHVPRESQVKLAEELRKHVPICIRDMHGNFVIQKCIEQMPPDSIQFIIDAVSDDVEKWATHTYGCRVIQRLLEHCGADKLDRVLSQILHCIPKLATDLYGNYVVQHMLEHGRKEDKSHILRVMTADIVKFSTNKQSSNVVEKCFEICSNGEHAQYLTEDCNALYQGVLTTGGLKQMIDDKYGNYIVQRMIEYSKGDDRVRVRDALLGQHEALRSTMNGKHILATWNKEFGESLQ